MARHATCECGDCQKCKRRVYMRRWAQRPENAEHNRQRARRYREENLEAIRAKDRARGYRPPAPEVRKARNAARQLPRQGCEICGEGAHAHHEDYSKPLEVVWLCPRHHGERHQRRPAVEVPS